MALAPATGSAALATRYNSKPVALTISGGVSLGSYEAGVNWALVRVLRETNAKLEAVTGASAGNINTVLTAYSWCGLDSKVQKPEESLFWNAWIPVDIDNLAPREFETGYADGDGVFSRSAFDSALDYVKKVSKTVAPADCSLRLGITLSKREAGLVTIDAGTKNLKIPAMRYVVPFKAAASAGQQLKFLSPAEAEINAWTIEELGLHLLPGPPGAEFTLEEPLLDYVQAASAFPYAFGSMNLKYWERRSECSTAPPKYVSDSGVFLDGGVFDNVPVGLALRLLAGGQSTQEGSFVIYIDPDQRRNGTPRSVEEQVAPLAGVDSTRAFLASAVGSARKQELQTVARYDLSKQELKNVEFRLTGRTTNVFGEYYAAFGAFTDRRFREMDFYLGIFDGMTSAAEWDCELKAPPLNTCVVDAVMDMRDQLALASQSPLATYVVDRLLVSTYPTEASVRGVSPTLPDAPAQKGGIKPMEVKLMMDVFTASEQDSFTGLLSALNKASEKAEVEWNSPIIDDAAGFAATYVNRILLRALTLERSNQDRTSIRVLAAASLITRSMIPQRDFEWDPSTIPDGHGRENYLTLGTGIAHALPYYLGFEFMPKGEFGFRAQWRPTWAPGSRVRLMAPVDASWMGSSNGFRLGLGVGTKILLHNGAGFSMDLAGGVGVWQRGLASSSENFPQSVWDAGDVSLQGGLTIFESLRVGYSFHTGPRLHSVSLGLIDFNGIAYWLTRVASGN